MLALKPAAWLAVGVESFTPAMATCHDRGDTVRDGVAHTPSASDERVETPG
jgi:hypothetical protein